MLALLLAVTLGAADCVTHECAGTEECWEVVITYREVVSAPGAPLQTVTRQVVNGEWGDQAGALCLSDAYSKDGFWLDPPPDGERHKIPASAIEAPIRVRVVDPSRDRSNE